MEATLERPVRQSVGTISMEHWDSLRTIDELDSALKRKIHISGLIDPNWREQPLRSWDDVYEDLCKDLGHHYGLSDIREA